MRRGLLFALAVVHVVIVALAVGALGTRWQPWVSALLVLWSCLVGVIAWRLNERQQAAGRMATSLAHDLNNSMSPILGFSELLLRQPDLPRDTARSYVELINAAAQNAASASRQLRALYDDDERTVAKNS